MIGIECIGNSGNIIYSFVKPTSIKPDVNGYIDYLNVRYPKYEACKHNGDIEQAYRICEEAFYEAEKYGYKVYTRRF